MNNSRLLGEMLDDYQVIALGKVRDIKLPDFQQAPGRGCIPDEEEEVTGRSCRGPILPITD